MGRNIQQKSKKVSNKIAIEKKLLTDYEYCCNIVKKLANYDLQYGQSTNIFWSFFKDLSERWCVIT